MLSPQSLARVSSIRREVSSGDSGVDSLWRGRPRTLTATGVAPRRVPRKTEPKPPEPRYESIVSSLLENRIGEPMTWICIATARRDRNRSRAVMASAARMHTAPRLAPSGATQVTSAFDDLARYAAVLVMRLYSATKSREFRSPGAAANARRSWSPSPWSTIETHDTFAAKLSVSRSTREPVPKRISTTTVAFRVGEHSTTVADADELSDAELPETSSSPPAGSAVRTPASPLIVCARSDSSSASSGSSSASESSAGRSVMPTMSQSRNRPRPLAESLSRTGSTWGDTGEPTNTCPVFRRIASTFARTGSLAVSRVALYGTVSHIAPNAANSRAARSVVQNSTNLSAAATFCSSEFVGSAICEKYATSPGSPLLRSADGHGTASTSARKLLLSRERGPLTSYPKKSPERPATKSRSSPVQLGPAAPAGPSATYPRSPRRAMKRRTSRTRG
eukprot:Amastigsp_a388_12.p2 type:complete len:450 gc:universal Amastigsp_a388_12:1986-637(-)